MDSVLAEVYSTVGPAAPFIIGAYALIWVCLLVFLIVMLRQSKRIENDIDALEDTLKRRGLTDDPKE